MSSDVLKRETLTDEYVNTDGNNNPKDNDPGRQIISDLEREYSEYVDSKYDSGEAQDGEGPSEHFSISKSPSAAAVKKEDERKLRADGDGDSSRALPKREQLTLFDDGWYY